MKNLTSSKSLVLIWTLSLFVLFQQAWGQDMKKGAFILISTEGAVNFIDESGQPASPVAVGKPIPSTHTVETGAGGKLVGLLSNGTLLTLVEKTKMKIGTFEQEPFEAGDKKLSDLKGEPSKSKVSVDLDFGSLVVKTKKLNKGSMFDINSPVGVAGIRGTEFQMASQPGQGVQLDVTESTVAFSPPGGGPPMDVSQGGGLSVSPSGVPTPRPVNPTVAQNIQSTNQAATEATSDVSLGEMTAAMDQATAESDAGDEQSGEESADESEESESEESTDSEESTESEESSSEESSGGEAEAEGSSETDAIDEPQASNEADTGEAAPEIASSPAQAEASLDTLLESNADAKQTRKTGKVGASAEDIAGLGLNAEQMEIFFDLPTHLQNKLKNEAPATVRRFINLDNMSVDALEIYFGYSKRTRSKILLLEDAMMLSLLENGFDEAILDALLTQENLANSQSEDVPTQRPSDARITALGDTLRASGNGEIFDKISEMNNGEWTDEWIETAEVANVIEQDYDLSKPEVLANWEEREGLDIGDVLENPFFEEAAATYDELSQLSYSLVEDHRAIAGRTITLGSGAYDLGDYTEKTGDFLIGASESLNLSGDISFDSDDHQNTRVVAMSGGSLNTSDGLNLTSAISDLVVTARDDILLRNSELSSINYLAVQSLRDLNLETVTLSASELIHLRATRDLNVDGLALSQGLPQLIMEATTIRLSNIDFPSATTVNLNSLKGPIDGKYPNFGTNISASDQIGRVNFIQNVSAGGTQNVMLDRATFDQYGTDITIGKITP